jgi:hypothetical protein
LIFGFDQITRVNVEQKLLITSYYRPDRKHLKDGEGALLPVGCTSPQLSNNHLTDPYQLTTNWFAIDSYGIPHAVVHYDRLPIACQPFADR